MLRCAFAAAALLAVAAPAIADRPFPANALRGDLVVTQPPEALINGQRVRLAPGVRIRGQNNLIVMSGVTAGQRLTVHYTRDLSGNLLDVWILTPAELAKKPWPTTPAQAAAWRFDPVAQQWSRP